MEDVLKIYIFIYNLSYFTTKYKIFQQLRRFSSIK